ncbi:MAG: hypothetical protein IJ859_09395 [Synergistaceae bacterium]|nr:hypothetical protein [Synergistaceae bacterium]
MKNDQIFYFLDKNAEKGTVRLIFAQKEFIAHNSHEIELLLNAINQLSQDLTQFLSYAHEHYSPCVDFEGNDTEVHVLLADLPCDMQEFPK